MRSRGFRKAIFVVIYKIDEKTLKPIYLILKRKLHWKGWEFTKGGVEFLETRKRAVKREVLEETGLPPIKITNHKVHGRYNYKKNIPSRIYQGQSYQLYSVKLKEGIVKIDNREHSSYLWLPYEKAVKKLTWENQKECLKIVNEYLIMAKKGNKFNNLIN